MPLDPALAGHETAPASGTITAAEIAAFADAIGDANPIYREHDAAQAAGYAAIPAPPTLVTRFRVAFADAGLDPTRSQVLHGEQEYEYTRPLVAGDTLAVRHRVASVRQSGRGNMAIMTIEQLGDTPNGERVVTGRSTVIVRDAPPEAAAAPEAASGGARAKPAAPVPQGGPIAALTKMVTQPQIDAYAEVSGDHNPIHVNPEAARAVGLDGTIAHGMLSMAFAGQLLTDWLAAQGTAGGYVRRLRVRFQGMVRPGDTLTVRGARGEREGDTQHINVWIDNQQGERVVTGDGDVVLRTA
ncbi:MAG TPA: MaoC family dehydratase N-terminal domain-containing protein [Ktedonobacterales bacterium]